MTDHTVQLNYLRLTPRKVRAVAGIIKGMPVNEAEAQLLLNRRRPAQALLKLLRSAVANAKNNRQLDVSKLYVKNIRVDQGPMLKRSLPRARGMATPLQKKMSHITLVLGEWPEARTPRFTITIKKKTKLAKEKKKTKKEKPQAEIEAKTRVKKTGGFFKRVFSRKSMSG